MHYVHGPDSGSVITSDSSTSRCAIVNNDRSRCAIVNNDRSGGLHPTAGAAPIDNAAKHAAADRVRAAALKLSREIRTPKAWIGYIAFVLFALLKQCRPRVCDGANKFCVIAHFAPWAKNMCSKECAYAAIPCAVRRNPSGVAECVQISEETPSPKCRITLLALTSRMPP